MEIGLNSSIVKQCENLKKKNGRVLIHVVSQQFLLKSVQNKNFRFYRLCGVPFWKKIITFLRRKYFFDAASSYFCRHETLFRATLTRFCRQQITFCVTSNFLFQHKIIFRATPNFCFDVLKILCHGDIFLLSHSNKNIITCK